MKKTRILAIIAIVLAILTGYMATIVFDLYTIRFDMRGQREVIREYGEPYEDPEVKAYAHPMLMPFLRKEIYVDRFVHVDVNKMGEQEVEYHAKTAKREGKATRKVIVEDHTPPEITLVADPDYYTLPGHDYVEEGFSAFDRLDGDVSDKVESRIENDKVIYTVTDAHGNTGTTEREIVYDDRKGPVISFDDGDYVKCMVNSTYNDKYKAVDDLDGDVTDKVKVEGKVDTGTLGVYTLKYTVSDSYGNETTAEKKVEVITNQGVIYLTFDDGPSAYTSRLLDILDKYKNVKVTFFVIGVVPSAYGNIKRAFNAGHAIGVHSLTHDYARIYSSDQAYWDDFEAMEDIIVQQTGQRTKLFRFPGGSSNTVSWNYNDGIMTRLAQQSKDKGLVYFDWNVESGDAGRTTDTNEVYRNIINGVQYYKTSVVLCHDSKSYTVDAIEDVIIWGLNNGYTFQALNENSFTAHHGINN